MTRAGYGHASNPTRRRSPRSAENGLAVFGILGDPNFFSTFSRLCGILAEHHPRIECRTEPGISSITAFAAAANVPLGGGFVVSDGADPSALIRLKARHPKKIALRASKRRDTGSLCSSSGCFFPI